MRAVVEEGLLSLVAPHCLHAGKVFPRGRMVIKPCFDLLW